MKLLTQEEYDLTFEVSMSKVTDIAEEVVDLWSYADDVIDELYHSCTAWEWKVAHIHETPDRQYQHIAIPVPKNDTYLLVIANIPKKTIVGHFILDLGALYRDVDSSDA